MKFIMAVQCGARDEVCCGTRFSVGHGMRFDVGPGFCGFSVGHGAKLAVTKDHPRGPSMASL